VLVVLAKCFYISAFTVLFGIVTNFTVYFTVPDTYFIIIVDNVLN
jgi:hypothetical protein